FKVVLALVVKRKWEPGLFLSNGGMPSSHSATVTTLSLLVGRMEGFDSSIFSLVLVFSLFVILEATGLRQEIGNQAQLLNELMDGVLAHRKLDQGRLRELVGHTWWEVFGGVVFGALWTIFVP
nr:divergent PAP2 family protein [Candidatus Krumholzibacteria bacterium]